METTTTNLKVVIAGRCRDGFHVHKPGCKDLRNYGPGRKMGGDDGGWEVDFDDFDPARGVAYAASRYIYEDHIGDYGYEYDSPEAVDYWIDCETDVRVFPCVKAPR